MPLQRVTDRIAIVTSNKERRRGEFFIKVDGEFAVKVYNQPRAEALARRIADFLAWEPKNETA